VARAKQPTLPVIGYLNHGSQGTSLNITLGRPLGLLPSEIGTIPVRPWPERQNGSTSAVPTRRHVATVGIAGVVVHAIPAADQDGAGNARVEGTGMRPVDIAKALKIGRATAPDGLAGAFIGEMGQRARFHF
jgi:hypothetical protein